MRFSIITPNWNGAKFLEECLLSVIDQDYSELEYIVVDGKSADGSLAIIDRYDGDLAQVICEPDNGHADALNKGFRASTGDIMGWINSDDILHPGTLSAVAAIFKSHPDIDWITGRPTSMAESGEINWVGRARPWSRPRFLAGDCMWIQQESTFWRRRLWEAAGSQLDTRYSVANDFELWTRFFRHAELFSFDRPLGCFRHRTGQRSVMFRSLYEKEADEILQRELDLLDPSFRAAFAPVLPESARRLDPEEAKAAERRLIAADPPVIRGISGRRAKGDGRFKRADPLSRAVSVSDISGLKGTGQKGKCIIISHGLRTMGTIDPGPETTLITSASDFIRLSFPSGQPLIVLATPACPLRDIANALDAALDASPAALSLLPARHDGDTQTDGVATRCIVPPAPNRLYLDLAAFAEIAPPSDSPHLTLARTAAFLGFETVRIVFDSAKPPGDHELEDLNRLAGELAAQAVVLEWGEEGFGGAHPSADGTNSGGASPKSGTLDPLRQLAARVALQTHTLAMRRDLAGMAWRNGGFLLLALIAVLIAAALFAAVEDANMKAVVFIGFFTAANAIIMITALVKIRRIMLSMLDQVSDLQKTDAKNEIKIMKLEISQEIERPEL
ncbi:glycosyl transferase family 2 [Glycocaulis alkaliphilus]|uniref:Glycosyl transferase family 2 n=1 Tax=Glycocaulis alkaliphilus TaxID=1434191 RepID=A0A3T0E762_9PROT|nr:glycosyltransferase family 2 protein [Glycocaulis alkaliphilus]AZU03100.1 glycosyl transferase family 2 [Glycocaulis alkaliphilus]GGB70983.1 hypothetical protein GCM10007417_08450 [Glycocaulis alkaliphilus]